MTLFPLKLAFSCPSLTLHQNSECLKGRAEQWGFNIGASSPSTCFSTSSRVADLSLVSFSVQDYGIREKVCEDPTHFPTWSLPWARGMGCAAENCGGGMQPRSHPLCPSLSLCLQIPRTPRHRQSNLMQDFALGKKDVLKKEVMALHPKSISYWSLGNSQWAMFFTK